MKDQQTTTLPAEWFAVMSEGQAYAAYPRKTLAEAYACGFSRSCEIIPFRVLGAPPPAAPSPTDPKACLRELVRIGRHTPSDLPFNQYDQWTEARQIEVLARFVAGLPFAPPEGWEPAIGPQGTTTEWRNGEERPISHRAFAEPIPTAAAPSRSTPAPNECAFCMESAPLIEKMLTLLETQRKIIVDLTAVTAQLQKPKD